MCGRDDSGGTLPKYEPSVICDVGWFIIYRSDKNPHYSWDTLLVTSDTMHSELVPQGLTAIMPVLWEMTAYWQDILICTLKALAFNWDLG